jgi:hypothetical protein
MCLLFLLMSSFSAYAGKLDKGFEALHELDYFKAKEYFEKAIDKEQAGAAFGLCKVYGAEKSPFFNVDTAFKFITISDIAFKLVEEKEIESLAVLEVTSVSIRREKVKLAPYFFNRSIEANTVEAYQDFIFEHPNGEDVEEAEKLRNHLAFLTASEINTMESLKGYLKDYPEATDFKSAEKKYHLLEYQKLTREGDAYSYQMFIENRTGNPYIGDAEEEVFKIYTIDGKPESYEKFIGENKQSKHINEAWETLFKLRTSTFSAASISEFMIDYPAYPKAEELAKELELARTILIPAKKGNLWGYVDTTGAWIMNPKFSWASTFSEGKATVGFFGKTVFINKHGTLIYSHMFDDALNFKNDLSIVEQEGYMGVISFMGDTVIPIVYDEIGAFSEGLVYAGLEDKYGYFDETGKKIVPFIYESAFDFINNKAIVKQNGLYGVINMIGQVLIPCAYEWIIPDSFNYVAKSGASFGLLSATGDTLLPFEYSSISVFSNGRAIAAKEEKYQYIDKNGIVAIETIFDFYPTTLNYSSFKNGYARIKQDGKVGIIDIDGNKVMPPIFKDMGYYDELLTPITKTDKWGYANAKVELAIPYDYDYAHNFENGFAVVENDTAQALINAQNELIIPFGFKEITRIDTNFIMVEKDGFTGVYNYANEELVPLEYNKYRITSNNAILLEGTVSMAIFWMNSGQVIYKEE